MVRGMRVCEMYMRLARGGMGSTGVRVQNQLLTAQSTQIKSVISVPIKDFIHHYPRALFNDIPRVGAYFYDIPGSGRSLTV